MNRHIPSEVLQKFIKGVVIPALPLALNGRRKFDEQRQRALLRYYFDAGAGGVAVAVHTTQFAVRDPKVNLYSTLLKVANEEFEAFTKNTGISLIRVAGVIGKTEQAVKEAELALKYGYHAVLLSVAAFHDSPNEVIISHCKTISGIIPVIGFYLQPAVGGRKLDLDFWRRLSEIENVIGIKIAPFNRYQTLDVVRGVIESGRSEEIALYTGNDDNILVDLLAVYEITHKGIPVTRSINGGLLGHWAVWTRSAVKLLEAVQNGEYNSNVKRALALANKITDCNAAFFDVANNFAGCITGLHEVLRRQGLFEGIWTLNENETLSPGQREEIERVYKAYPELNDDQFVRENLKKWMS